MKADFTVGVVGNPNCGKTTLFNVLTGARQQVGNWPGVTVEKKVGQYQHGGKLVELVDLPGTYSLEATDDNVALDEKIARDYVASRQADLVINIVDASNIERHLYLTAQLLEMRVPMLLVLNMMDVARRRGIKIDTEALGRQLGCPVLAVSAAAKQGVGALKNLINEAAPQKALPTVTVTYPQPLEQAAGRLCQQLGDIAAAYPCDPRWLALRLLEGDTLASQIAGPGLASQVKSQQPQLERDCGDELDILFADARYGFVNQLTRLAVAKAHAPGRHVSQAIDRFVLNRFLGIPFFLLVMYAMFMFTINVGGVLVDFFDQATGALLVDGLAALLGGWGWPQWLVVLLANGVGGGVQVVSTFIPIVGCLFLFLSALEDSGYMARAAFVMDRFMCMIGLPGKSFVPMIVGFGCNVPAIMATRTLDSARDRILTNLMNPFMSCGARLPVYALFAAAFFPVGGQNLVFGLYLCGILAAVLTGLVMRYTLFKGVSSPFIMELPAYHLPSAQNVLLRAWDRLRGFLQGAGKIIVPMVVVLNVLNATGTDGRFGLQNGGQSLLSAIGRALTPAFEPMGISDANWPATVGIFTGVLAKEAVVGTLDTLYGQMARADAAAPPAPFQLQAALASALETIPANAAALADRLLDPLGLDIAEAGDWAAAAQRQAVQAQTFAAMRQRFDGQAGAFAYLLFILLYAPCVAATAAIHRETNWGWAVFIVCWSTGLAYLVATLFYQTARFSRHPAQSLAWIGGVLAVFGLALCGLWLAGKLARLKQNNGVRL